MDNSVIWAAITIISLVFGFVHYRAGYYTKIDEHNRYFKFLEFFRYAANYFVTLTIVYYFMTVKSTLINEGFSFGDFFLLTVFLIGLFGWLPYLLKNITEKVDAIFAKILNK